MDLNKLKNNNPNWNFSDKPVSKPSNDVLRSSVQSNMNIDSYKMKYADRVILKDASPAEPAIDDSSWKQLLKTSKNMDADSPASPKTSFFDENGEERAVQG